MLSALLFVLLWLATVQSKSVLSGGNINSDLLQIIDSYMDYGQDPCENFYEYACGAWEQVHADGRNYVDTIGSLEYEANVEMAAILEHRIKAAKRETHELYRKVRAYYESCRAELNFNVNTYLEILKPTDGIEWPEWLHENKVSWQGDSWNCWATLGKMRAFGISDIFIEERLKNVNATSFILHLNKMESVELNKEQRRLLQELSESVYLSDRLIAQKLSNFQDKLKTLASTYADKSFQLYELTLSELEQRVRGLNFKAYLRESLERESLDGNMRILVGNLGYLRKLHDLLLKTPPETVLNYIKLKVLAQLKNQMPSSSAPHHCMANMREHMSLALDYIYEQENYRFTRQQSDATIRRVFQAMQAHFLEIIDEHAYEFSVAELQFLKQKISRMQLNIGNLPRGANEHYYRAYYQPLQVEPTYFYWNNLNAMQLASQREHYLLQVDTTAVEHSFFTWKYASPAYNQATNLLLIPFSYLQMPIFHRDFHPLFLFAELGNSLGHEIIHGFDLNGLKYDYLGNPTTLFNEALPQKPDFLRSLECLHKERTSNINEKIADFSGFRLAYESYFNGSSTPINELQHVLSDKQLFFVKFAQFFCAVNVQRIQYDETHDTPFKRVPQAVANYYAFAEEFGCRAYSRMSPTRRCLLW